MPSSERQIFAPKICLYCDGLFKRGIKESPARFKARGFCCHECSENYRDEQEQRKRLDLVKDLKTRMGAAAALELIAGMLRK